MEDDGDERTIWFPNSFGIQKIRLAIMGVGGVGGYLGAKLLTRYSPDKNFEIIFIQRGEHLG